MTRRNLLAELCALVLLTTVIACSEDTETPSGSASVLSEMSYQETTFTVGTQSTLSGTFTFADPDSDAKMLHVELTMPSGQSQPFPTSEPQGVHGKSAGTVMFALAVIPPAPGTYTFEMWLSDDGGNDSNKLSGTFDAL